jgi:hypothetical protein
MPYVVQATTNAGGYPHVKSKRFTAVLVAIAAIAVAMVVAMPAGAAGNGAQVSTFDPTGAVFPCSNGTSYTITGGLVKQVFRDSFDAAGGEHVTGTITPMGVTLTDGTSNTVYRLAGASWFGGSFNAAGMFVATDTAHFNILGPSGGPVANVQLTEHFSSGGTNFSFDFGNCSEPN